jgi:hypothetical protein
VNVEADIRRGADWLASDDGATWMFRAALAVSCVLLYVVGRKQWFTADDWAFVFTRERFHRAGGLGDMLFRAQDGHWMTIPIIVFRVIKAVFGTGSYWPYLIPTMVCHLATAVMLRRLCLRVGVRPWTATILASMLAVFGSGWENIVFAIQIVYNLSLLAFLVHVTLIDHDGPPDRRDALGAIAGLIAVSSSGFGPFFILGVATFTVMRRRWRAALIAVVPMALAEAWWWLFWGQDPAGESLRGSRAEIPAYVRRGLEAVFQDLTSMASLVGISMIATVAVLLWRRRDATSHDVLFSLALTSVAIYVGLAIQRGGLGVDNAASARYAYVGAVLLIPAFGVAVDLLGRVAPPALWAGYLVLGGATAVNIGALVSNGDEWAARSGGERTLLALVAASPLLATVDQNIAPLYPASPDVRVGDIAELVDDGAIHPRPAVTPAEQALVDKALSQPAPP